MMICHIIDFYRTECSKTDMQCDMSDSNSFFLNIF